MKLFIVATLIAVAAAGRLEHLERSYLPPDNDGSNFGAGSNGFGSDSGFGSSFGRSSHDSDSFGSNQGSFGSNQGSFGSNQGSSDSNQGSFGSNQGSLGAATSNRYLPPDHGPSSSGSSNGFNSFARSSVGAPSNFGQLGGFGGHPNGFGQPGGFRGQSSGFGGQSSAFGGQSSSFGGQSSGFGGRSSGFGQSNGNFGAATSDRYLPPNHGSSTSGNFGGSSFRPGSSFGSQSQYQQPQFGTASRQYIAPKTSSSFQIAPQQAFDEQTGYQY